MNLFYLLLLTQQLMRPTCAELELQERTNEVHRLQQLVQQSAVSADLLTQLKEENVRLNVRWYFNVLLLRWLPWQCLPNDICLCQASCSTDVVTNLMFSMIAIVSTFLEL